MPFITQGKTNLKYILIVVILAIVVGGGILGYYYLWIAEIETKLAEIELRLSPKVIEDETANWKTYRNEEYEFEFKYPKEFAENDKCTARKYNDGISVGYRIDIAIEDSRGLSVSEYVDQDFKQDDFEDVQREKSIVDGKEAIAISYRTVGVGRLGVLTYVLRDGRVYIFSFLAGPECPAAYETGTSELLVYAQILNTFRFLE